MAVADRDAPNPLEYALGYRLEGRPVFPVCTAIRPGLCVQHGRCVEGGGGKSRAGKVPLVPWKDYQTRLPTEAEIGEWWGRWPDANIGMATGALSGVVALDADGSEARKEALRRGVPLTPTVFTGKPGGCHFHLRHPGHEVKNFVRGLPGLDFRGDGGYVLLPPSRHESGNRYRWADGTAALAPAPMPGWLAELLASGSGDGTGAGEREPLDLELIAGGIPEGRRDDMLWRFACKLRGDGLPLEYARVLVEDAARRCRPPFDRAAALEKVERAYREYAAPTILEVAGVAGPTVVLAPLTGYALQSSAEFLNWELESSGPLIQGLLWERQIHWLFSAVNVGKTMLALAWAIHIAAGRPFCGRRVRQGPVLFIEEDSSLAKLREYYEYLLDLFELDGDELPITFNKAQGLRLTTEAELRAALAMVDGLPVTPVAAFHDAAESIVPTERYTSKELDPMRRYLVGLSDRGIASIMADHTKQQQYDQKGKVVQKEPMERLFGGLVKKRVADYSIHLTGGLKVGKLTCTFAKARGELPDPVEIDFSDERGFEITTALSETRTPTEREIVRWFNHHGGLDWVERGELIRLAGVNERSADRALMALSRRGLLEREMASKRDGARYRLSQDAPPVRFD